MSRYFSMLTAIGMLLVVVPAYASADVVESSETGFVVKIVTKIAGSPAKGYETLVKDIGRWWDPAHTYSRDARNLSIDPRPGGCFCERLPDQGGVHHATVIFASPARKLRLSGGLGPLQEAGVSGSLAWDFVEAEGGTQVTLTYAVGGYRQGGLQSLASPVDSVLSQQLQRLKNYVERGTPAP